MSASLTIATDKQTGLSIKSVAQSGLTIDCASQTCLHVDSSPQTALEMNASGQTSVLLQFVGVGLPVSSGGGGLFIQDITAPGGIVAMKEWRESIPPESHIQRATTDTEKIRVWVGVSGGSDSYSPEVTVNGIVALLTESGTKRWFTGYADITVPPGESVITALCDNGAKDVALITLAGPGPKVLSVTFGPYPGAQTELKAGDTIQATITTEPAAVELTVLASGACASAVTTAVTGGTATVTLPISSANEPTSVQVRAKNSLGTYGDLFTSDALTLNQTYPSVQFNGATYPSLQGALNAGESGIINATASQFDTIHYTSPDLDIADPLVYAVVKPVTNTRTGYVGAGTNVTITANRAANNATTTRYGLVRIATVPPQASIAIIPSGRLLSSPAGQDYTVRLIPDQMLSGTPSLNASHGAWQGVWTNAGAYWQRTLRISDSTPRGEGLFSSLQMTGLSGIAGNTITSGATYTVGGFTQRTVVFPAFSRVAALGVAVGNEAKVTAQISGGNVLTRYSDNTVRQNGCYIANADGSYNPNGDHIGLSDTVFAGSNTSGTLAVIVSEVA